MVVTVLPLNSYKEIACLLLQCDFEHFNPNDQALKPFPAFQDGVPPSVFLT
jgi:hypothetical protein